MTNLATLARLDRLEGLIPRLVGHHLHHLAANVPADLAIVEIGSYKGKSTAYLAAGAAAGHGAPVYAVDPWDLQDVPPPGPGPAGVIRSAAIKYGFGQVDTREAFHRQLSAAGVADRVTAIRGFSTDVAAQWYEPPVGLLYLDGDHTEAGVAADVTAWWPLLANPATIVFDDYVSHPANAGVALVADRLAGHVDVEYFDRLAIANVRGEPTPWPITPPNTGSDGTPPATTPAPVPEAPPPRPKPPT